MRPAEVRPSSAGAAHDPAQAHDGLAFLASVLEAHALGEAHRRGHGPDRQRLLHVIVLSGFLGAGKTTVLRRLLGADHGLRLTALVNDFGDLAVDAALIADRSADTLTLTNGCVCCTQSGGAVRALLDLQARAVVPDRVLLEASGVADPGVLTAALQSVQHVVVDMVVTVVDAQSGTGTDLAPALVARQLHAADLVVLNKCDGLGRDAVAARVEALRQAAPCAVVLATEHGAVPPAIVLDGLGTPAPAAPATPAGEAFWSLSARCPSPVDRSRLQRCVGEAPAALARVKGFVRCADTPAEVSCFQAVGRRWRWDDAPQGEPVGVGRLVFIGLGDGPARAQAAQHLAAHGMVVDDL